MNNKIIAGIASVALVLGLAGLLPEKESTPVSQDLIRDIVKQVQLGAIPGDEISGNRFTVGGLTFYAESLNTFISASTTCTLRSDPTATSTLLYAWQNYRTGSTSAMFIEAGKATNNRHATTTSLGTTLLAASTQGTFVASTTPFAGLDSVRVFQPGDFLNFKQSGGITTGSTDGTGFVPTGSCGALWVTI